MAGDIQFPNGMIITPDGKTLIISESFAGRLTALGTTRVRVWFVEYLTATVERC